MEKDYSEIMKSKQSFVCRYAQMPTEKQIFAKKLTREYDEHPERREEIFTQLFGTYHPLVFIERGFHCDYGFNIHFHGLTVINYNVVMLDTSPIDIGAGAFIAPGCVLACSGHAIDPIQRVDEGIGTSAPITLEDNVWLGANVTVCGGVTIGEGSVIGAGSVVTKSIPAGVIAYGNPCKVARKISEKDKIVLED